jgi:hypothetical protein
MRWSVKVTGAKGRAPLWLETQRHWSDQVIPRTTPVRLALCLLITVAVIIIPLGLGHRPGDSLANPPRVWISR